MSRKLRIDGQIIDAAAMPNPDKVYVKMEGWFTEEELSRFLIWTIDGIGSDNGS